MTINERIIMLEEQQANIIKDLQGRKLLTPSSVIHEAKNLEKIDIIISELLLLKHNKIQ